MSERYAKILALIQRVKELGSRSENLLNEALAVDNERSKAIEELESLLAAERQTVSKSLTTAQAAEAFLIAKDSSATVAEITEAVRQMGVDTNEDSVRSLLVRRHREKRQFWRVAKNTYNLIGRK